MYSLEEISKTNTGYFPIIHGILTRKILLTSELTINADNKGKAQTFIVKPEASCQGRSIYLAETLTS